MDVITFKNISDQIICIQRKNFFPGKTYVVERTKTAYVKGIEFFIKKGLFLEKGKNSQSAPVKEDVSAPVTAPVKEDVSAPVKEGNPTTVKAESVTTGTEEKDIVLNSSENTEEIRTKIVDKPRRTSRNQ